ncbi:hypothetical protein E2542_SST07000 [Spatholobus suberectus]|nr:hypothetical protein E2542_SST07000 [Spatholobus suberectus]
MMPCDCEYDYVSHSAMCSASCLPVVDLLMSLGMGKKERFRNLKDLYDTSQQLQPTQPFNFGMKETSIACSHRITRCSLDAYFHRVPAISSVGIGHFTNKTPKEKRVSRCPSNDGVLVFPSLSSAGDCRQHTSSKKDPACQIFLNQQEKHKEVEILGDNIASIRRLDSRNVALSNHNGGLDRETILSTRVNKWSQHEQEHQYLG